MTDTPRQSSLAPSLGEWVSVPMIKPGLVLVAAVEVSADEINANPEYLAHFPPHSPSSTEYADRLGWTLQDRQWVFGGAQKAGARVQSACLQRAECRGN